MSKNLRISRRTLLKGLGVSVALPWLEGMLPAVASATPAARVGTATRFPSLEVGCEGGRQAGNCDSGYSCAYSSNLSWRSPTTPLPKEVNPRLVFDRLFGGPRGAETDQNRLRREHYNQSI